MVEMTPSQPERDPERDVALDLKRAMGLAVDTIQSLRRENQLLGAQVEVVNLFRAIIMPRTSQGMSEDAAWLLQRELDRINAAEQAAQLAKSSPTGGL